MYDDGVQFLDLIERTKFNIKTEVIHETGQGQSPCRFRGAGKSKSPRFGYFCSKSTPSETFNRKTIILKISLFVIVKFKIRIFLFPLSAVEVLFAPTKSTQKSAPGRSLSIL